MHGFGEVWEEIGHAVSVKGQVMLASLFFAADGLLDEQIGYFLYLELSRHLIVHNEIPLNFPSDLFPNVLAKELADYLIKIVENSFFVCDCFVNTEIFGGVDFDCLAGVQ